MSQKSKLDFAQAASIIGQIKSPPVQAGGFNSPAIHPALSDFIGS